MKQKKNQIKYVHTNLVAKDWKKLARFYIEVFDCVPIAPERNLHGDWLDRITCMKGLRIRGIHLKLPGYNNGPTLEIFQYNKPSVENKKCIHNYGFGHTAFHVSNVEEILEKILAGGGSKYGELIEKEIEYLGIIKAIYVKDPEDNIIEIQNWRKRKS